MMIWLGDRYLQLSFVAAPNREVESEEALRVMHRRNKRSGKDGKSTTFGQSTREEYMKTRVTFSVYAYVQLGTRWARQAEHNHSVPRDGGRKKKPPLPIQL